MDNNNQGFLDSLDLVDKEMEKYIPYALQDLWQLGSIPAYIFHLIDNNINPNKIKTIVDFGCGKGAVLIYLAKRLDFHGYGIDIVPDFIQSAIEYAKENSVDNQLEFIVDDMANYKDSREKYDIVIYGYDSDILGDIYNTIAWMQNKIVHSGYLILEIAFTPDGAERIKGLPTQNELIAQMEKSELTIIDSIYWDIDKVKTINELNNSHIKKRIQELIRKYPGKTKLFEQYMSNQLEESKLIENHMICSSWILRKSSFTSPNA